MANPLFVDASYIVAPDNMFIDVVFDQGVYGDALAAGPVELADLVLTFVKGGGVATAAVKASLSSINRAPLLGGETIIRLWFDVTGVPDGVETIEIEPTDGASIYNAAGEAMAGTETTGALNLIDYSSAKAATGIKKFDVEESGFSGFIYVKGIKWVVASGSAGHLLEINDLLGNPIAGSISLGTSWDDLVPIKDYVDGLRIDDLDSGYVLVYTGI